MGAWRDLSGRRRDDPGLRVRGRARPDERIEDHSDATRSFAYHIDGAPLPVSDHVGTFVVTARGAGCEVIWESSFTPLHPAMAEQLAQMWEPYLPVVLNNLETVVEAG